jgi:hypothetical protein
LYRPISQPRLRHNLDGTTSIDAEARTGKDRPQAIEGPLWNVVPILPLDHGNHRHYASANCLGERVPCGGNLDKPSVPGLVLP